MPPKVKYAKEEIIRAALDVVRGEINEFLALSEKKC